MDQKTCLFNTDRFSSANSAGTREYNTFCTQAPYTAKNNMLSFILNQIHNTHRGRERERERERPGWKCWGQRSTKLLINCLQLANIIVGVAVRNQMDIHPFGAAKFAE